MKKFIPACLISIVAAGILSVSSVMAASNVSVVLDGKKIEYAQDDAQPQIINNRTMVPLRATGEAFGVDFEWNADTRVVSFKANDKVVTHVVNQNFIYINGVPTECDYASVVVQNRVLFSVRMLSEALGKDVDWDASERKVIITSANEKPTPSPSPSPSPSTPSVPVSQVTKVETDKTKVGVGETVKFTITADNNTTGVKISIYGQQKILAMTKEYTENGSYRTFELEYKPEEANSALRIGVYSSNEAGFKLNADQIVSLNVTTESQTSGSSTSASPSSSSGTTSGTKEKGDAVLEKYVLEAEKVKSGNSLDIVIYSNNSARSAWVEDANEKVISKASDYSNYNSSYVWRFSFKPTETGYYYFCVADSKDKVDYEKVYITVESASSSKYDNSNFISLSLKESGNNNNTGSSSLIVDEYTYVNVEIQTGRKIDYLIVTDDDGNEIYNESKDYEEEDGKYIWTFSFQAREDHKYTAVIKYDNVEKNTRTFTVNVND